MDINVLGVLAVRHRGVDAVPTARKPRKVLALLLLNGGHAVPVSALVSELWDVRPPKSALTTMQTYILQLRKELAAALGWSLAEVAERLLQTCGNSYRFDTDLCRLDLDRYWELDRSATAALSDGDLRAAHRDFREALALWAGPALMDVEQGRLLRAAVARLEQSRLTMIEHRFELDLRLGLHRVILDELAGLTAQHRFHEDLCAQYILALYRSGQRIRAMGVFHDLRKNMIDELGLEPSPKLQRLVRSVLTCDPALDDTPIVPLPRLAEADRALA
ncbi:AfsR/SARP family transcriptional regulator [Kutzneria buriramensis]|uniref:DNA-binding SARP family transcriptional activator n=1 Tax=Kutzneria buriramensis TaxID=1045776 RepID=A0A3E0GYT7_9PSEU|nr:AfsR/SARP family transcriptional regulator [Kutzneria buriramensis]REH32556.1 DNA-binding SARP family transcriptional activator [Kutzneria buriramensis]